MPATSTTTSIRTAVAVAATWQTAKFFRPGPIGTCIPFGVLRRFKGNEGNDTQKLHGYSCYKRFDEREMDVIEMAVYGSVKRADLDCRCRSVMEMVGELQKATGLPVANAFSTGAEGPSVSGARPPRDSLPNCT